MNSLTFLIENRRFLAFGLACTLVSNFGQTFFIALFGDHVRAEFNLSHGDFAAIYGLATLVSAAIILWAGRQIDKVDLRLYTSVVLAGLSVSAGVFALSTGPLVLGLAFVGLRLFGQGLLRHTAVVSMARYFDAARGRAVSVVGLGYPIAEATFPALLVILLASLSWREAWGVFALYVGVLHLPLVLWLLKGHGVRHAKLEKKLKESGDDDAPLTQRALLADWRFVTIVPAALMGPFVMTGIFFHQLALADAKGWTMELLAASFPVFAASTVITNLITGWLVDRQGPGRILPVFVLPIGLCLLVIATMDQTWSVPLYMMLGGLTVGSSSVLISAAWAETYGVRHLGTIRSLTSSLAVVSTALAPVLVGELLDIGTNFSAIAFGAAALVFASAVLILAPAKRLREEATQA
ncbi:MFS transporter [Magnetovibrio sp. PR-2]|uniref:MFS transporter n=1 Tax=Magnetovibrio sp. PR-2 TaxID=3120356 RepID=UPI002FCE485E